MVHAVLVMFLDYGSLRELCHDFGEVDDDVEEYNEEYHTPFGKESARSRVDLIKHRSNDKWDHQHSPCNGHEICVFASNPLVGSFEGYSKLLCEVEGVWRVQPSHRRSLSHAHALEAFNLLALQWLCSLNMTFDCQSQFLVV